MRNTHTYYICMCVSLRTDSIIYVSFTSPRPKREKGKGNLVSRLSLKSYGPPTPYHQVLQLVTLSTQSITNFTGFRGLVSSLFVQSYHFTCMPMSWLLSIIMDKHARKTQWMDRNKRLLSSTCLDTNPSLSLSIVRNILSMWVSSPRNSSKDNLPSEFLSRILKKPSTSRLSRKGKFNQWWKGLFRTNFPED